VKKRVGVGWVSIITGSKKKNITVLAAEKSSTFKKVIFGGCTVEIKGCP